MTFGKVRRFNEIFVANSILYIGENFQYAEVLRFLEAASGLSSRFRIAHHPSGMMIIGSPIPGVSRG
jgi:hypothetical protein